MPLRPQDHWRKEWRGARHKEAAERAYCCPAPLDQYVTAGRGGQLRCAALPALRCLQGCACIGLGWGAARPAVTAAACVRSTHHGNPQSAT